MLAVSLLITVGFAVAAAGVRFNNGFETFFDQSDTTYYRYLKYMDDFGSDESSYILYEARGFEHGPWNLEVMRKIATLTTAL